MTPQERCDNAALALALVEANMPEGSASAGRARVNHALLCGEPLPRPAGYRTFRDDGPLVGIAFVCPCGCGAEGFLPMEGRGHPHEWHWDGNREAPTLNPSIQQVGGCRWHGWLRNGEWVAA